MDLNSDIKFAKGVGPKLSQVLARRHISTIRDALYYFPRSYEDRRKLLCIAELSVGPGIASYGRILSAHPISFTRSRRKMYQVVLEDLEDANAKLYLKWFQMPYFRDKFKVGQLLAVFGKVENYRGQFQMVHPDLEFLGKNLPEASLSKGILPNYSLTEGLYQKTIRRIEKSVVKTFAPELEDPMPHEILERYGWPPLSMAVKKLHLPSADEDFDKLEKGETKAHQRLIYEEFFLFSMALAIRKQNYRKQSGLSFHKPEKLWQALKDNLPYEFTGAQKRVLKEILTDMEKPEVMHRMVQGDVGSGKTVVAAAGACVALESGFQVALMAPTEVLAEQHAKNFQTWFGGSGIEVVLLTGSKKAKERKDCLEKIAEDKPRVIVGTHALFEDKVQFAKLGLVIVDEQHRFGVRQRARLIEKGESPDILVMTATPIPRTLSLTIYGDLDISVIDELPPGRKPIDTRVFTDKKRSQMEQAVLQQLEEGRQVYIIFPLIEESEKMDLKSIDAALPHLRSVFRKFNVSYLHGRMDSEEKQKVLSDFKENKIQVLVSTTVVEVGVDVPNASVMVIEHAERFGLSQLHQLRGRVGRGSAQSYCFLVASHMGTDEIVKRLRTLEMSNDGFELAEVDLEMRGPGDFFGTRQSGLPSFQLAMLPRDYAWLARAREDAFKLIEASPQLQDYPVLKKCLNERFENLSIS